MAKAATWRQTRFNPKCVARPFANAEATAKLSVRSKCLCSCPLPLRHRCLTAQPSELASSSKMPAFLFQRLEPITRHAVCRSLERGISSNPTERPRKIDAASEVAAISFSSARWRGASVVARGPRNRARSRSRPVPATWSRDHLPSTTPNPHGEASTATTSSLHSRVKLARIIGMRARTCDSSRLTVGHNGARWCVPTACTNT
jgi:hypothetical protein